jgi:hypothetical protein
MKQKLFLLALVAGLSACKKDEQLPQPQNPTVTASDYVKLAIGNYWVYENVMVDPSGAETPMSVARDSFYISGDTVIGANTYFIRKGSLYGNPLTSILRDSSGYIVGPGGGCEFTLASPGATLWSKTEPGIYHMEGALQNYSVAVVTPAGTFSCRDIRGTVNLYAPYDQFGATRYTHYYYGYGVGKVKEVQFFIGSPSTVERRLVNYHVN